MDELSRYRRLKFLFDVRWVCCRQGMDFDERENFLMEVDFLSIAFQSWMN